MLSFQAFLAIFSFFTLVRPAVIEQRDKDCAASGLNVALVNEQVTHPLYFCTFYLEDTRTRSPLLGLSTTALTSACECISSSATAQNRAAARNAIKKASQSTTPISSTCPASSANFLAKEYVYPSTFCTFYNAYPRTTSPVPNENVKAVIHACNCILGKVATTKTTSPTSTKKTSTKKTSTSTQKSSVKTSPTSSRKSSTSTSSRKTTSTKKTSTSTQKAATTKKSSSSTSTKKTSASSAKSSSSKRTSTQQSSSTKTTTSTSRSLTSSAISTSKSSPTSSSSSKPQTSSTTASTTSLSSTKVSSTSSMPATSIASTTTSTGTTPVVTVDAYDVITSQGYEPFCSTYLGFTTPYITIMATQTDTEVTVQTNVATEVSTSTYISAYTESDISTVTELTTLTTTSPTSVVVLGKRSRVTAQLVVVPTLLVGYPESSLSSACSRAVSTPETVTISSATTLTTFTTSVTDTTTTDISSTAYVSSTTEQSTTTITSTSVSYATPTPSQLIVNPSFEIEDDSGSYLTPWSFSDPSYFSATTPYTEIDGPHELHLNVQPDGNPISTTFMQSVIDLVEGTDYALEYKYILGGYGYSFDVGISATLTVSIGSEQVQQINIDFNSFEVQTRSLIWTATSASAEVLFEVVINNFLFFELGFDAITLTEQ